MRICSIRLKNHRCFKDQLNWAPKSNINILVGENNSGKSTLFKFISKIHQNSQYNETNFGQDEWYHRNTENNIDFEIKYQIEMQFINELNALRKEVNVSNLDILKFIFQDHPIEGFIDPHGSSTQEKIWGIADQLKEYVKIITNSNISVNELQSHIHELLEKFHGGKFHAWDYKNPGISDIPPYIELLAGFALYTNSIKSNNLRLQGSIKFNDISRPFIQLDNFLKSKYHWELINDDNGYYHINHYQNLFRTWLSKVEKAIIDHLASSIIYIEEIRMRALDKKERQYTCPDGRNLASVLTTLKMDKIPENRQKYENIKNEFNSFYPEYDFEVVENPTSNLEIQIIDKRETMPLTLEEYGTGMMDILIILTNLMTVEDKIIVLEEPETHIHPIFQRKLMKIIEKASEKNQIFITTHSPSFFSFNDLESIVRLAQIEKSSYLYPFNMNFLIEQKNQRFSENKCDESTIKARYSKILTPQVKNAFFSKGVILVEGETEALSLPIWSKYQGFDLDLYSIEIVNCFSKFNIIDIAELLLMYKIPFFIIFDQDNPETDSRHKQHNDWIVKICEQDKNIITQKNWISGKQFFMFTPRYEEAIAYDDSEYKDVELSVSTSNRFNLSGQKGLKAYYTSLKYVELEKLTPDVIKRLIDTMKSFFDAV